MLVSRTDKLLYFWTEWYDNGHVDFAGDLSTFYHMYIIPTDYEGVDIDDKSKSTDKSYILHVPW